MESPVDPETAMESPEDPQAAMESPVDPETVKELTVDLETVRKSPVDPQAAMESPVDPETVKESVVEQKEEDHIHPPTAGAGSGDPSSILSESQYTYVHKLFNVTVVLFFYTCNNIL